MIGCHSIAALGDEDNDEASSRSAIIISTNRIEDLEKYMEFDVQFNINDVLSIHTHKLREIRPHLQNIIQTTYNYQNKKESLETVKKIGSDLRIIFEPVFSEFKEELNIIQEIIDVNNNYAFQNISSHTKLRLVKVFRECEKMKISVDGKKHYSLKKFLKFVLDFVVKTSAPTIKGTPDWMSLDRGHHDKFSDFLASIYHILTYLSQKKLNKIRGKTGASSAISNVELMSQQLEEGKDTELKQIIYSDYRKYQSEIFELNATADQPFITGRIATYHYIKHREMGGPNFTGRDYYNKINRAFQVLNMELDKPIDERNNITSHYSQDGKKKIYTHKTEHEKVIFSNSLNTSRFIAVTCYGKNNTC